MMPRPRRVLLLRHRAMGSRAYGGPVYTESLLRLLQQAEPGHQVEQLVFEPQPGALADRLYIALAILRSLVSTLPATAERFCSAAYRHRLLERLATARDDLVLINGLDMLWCLPLLAGRLPVVYVCHNLETALLTQRIARHLHWPGVAALLRRDAAKLEALELRGMRGACGVIAVAPNVAAGAAAMAPETPVLTLPPTFSAPRWQPIAAADPAPPTAPVRLGFFGNLGWWPNRVSLNWFLSEVWPHVGDGYVLHLFGSGSERIPARRGLVPQGYVTDLSQVWRTAQILIQPIVTGAGVSIKVAEALYHRRPMIVTPLGLRGCATLPDPAILVADGAAAWIELLRGELPRRLVGSQVSEANAERFAQGERAGHLATFLAGLMDGTADAAAATPGEQGEQGDSAGVGTLASGSR